MVKRRDRQMSEKIVLDTLEKRLERLAEQVASILSVGQKATKK